MGSRRHLLLGLAVGVLALPATAESKTYCVSDPACPAGGIAEPSVAAAVTAADADVAGDEVRIGPGTFSASGIFAANAVDIRGAGVGRTLVESAGGDAFFLSNAGSSATDLGVRLGANDGVAFRLQDGADLARVKVTILLGVLSTHGVIAENPGSSISQLTTELGPDVTASIAVSSRGATIVDANLTAAYGVAAFADPSATTVNRVDIRAAVGLQPFGGILNATNVRVRPHPAGVPFFYGASVNSSNGGPETKGTLNATNLTIIGNGSSGSAGIQVATNDGEAQANVHATMISGVDNHLWRSISDANDVGNITIDHSLYDKTQVVSDPSGSGTITQGLGNLDTAPDPRFMNGAGGDHRPRYDSPLIDAGGVTINVPGAVSLDLAGRERVRDGDGNGDARRDIGAYEYQHDPPVPVFGFAPSSPLRNQTAAFDSGGTVDPDGDPITALAWNFGDGSGAAGPAVSHRYATSGVHQASLTATDVTGLAGTTVKPVAVTPAPDLRRFRLSNRRFRVGKKRTALVAARRRRAPKGTRFRFQLTQRATVRVRIERAVIRRVRGKRRRAYKLVKTLTRRNLQAGERSIPFSGRLGRKALRRGKYRARATATDAAGNKSARRSARFTVVKR